jgi:integration host factor subunit beta
VISNFKVIMNKLELIAELAKQQGLSRPESTRTVGLFFDAICQALSRGNRVEIRGLCAFKVKEYPSYTGHNPKTGDPVTVKGKKLPFFRCGTDLKKRVDR